MSGISSTAYDRLMRLPIICFTAYFFITEILSLDGLLARPPIGWDWSFAGAVGARVALLGFLGLLILFHAIRSQPINKALGWEPKVSALLGLTLGNLFMLMDRPELSLELNLLSALSLLVGNYFCIVVLMHLGRSLSIMAEARRLVTTGPYAVVRIRSIWPRRSRSSVSSCSSCPGKRRWCWWCISFSRSVACLMKSGCLRRPFPSTGNMRNGRRA
jgi:hypothetical protein